MYELMPDSEVFSRALESFSQRLISDTLELLGRAEYHGAHPDNCAAYRWCCWMLTGRFEEAWRESDEIARRGGPDPYRFWDGLPFWNKRVIIRCLHGFGDAIQFIRYAPLVRSQASRVIVQTHPELLSVMRAVPGVDEVITWPDENRATWDQQIELMELPRAFRTTLDTIPCEIPYVRLTPEQKLRSRIRARRNGRPRIGLQWGSGTWNIDRSLRLTELRPLLGLPEFEYYSFQRGEQRNELRSLESYQIQDVSGEAPDILEAAADLLNIDLLISADTMLAHLAGALGKQVWVLLPFESDWRWMLERRDSPWYPTMRLFRQPARGDWASAVLQACAELQSAAEPPGGFRPDQG